MKISSLLALSLICLSLGAQAQTLSPQDIARMLDNQTDAPNPYAALLNDPDPARSMGAMRIMMESGDDALIEIALAHGLLSANEAVQTAALESYLRTAPRVLVTIDASKGSSRELSNVARRIDGVFSENGTLHGRWQIGEYSPAKECTLLAGTSACAFTININGIFLTADFGNSQGFKGKMTVSPDGNVVGDVIIGNKRYPMILQLLD